MPHLSTHATLYSVSMLVVPLGMNVVEDGIHSLAFPFYNSDESQNKNKLIGLHPLDSQIVFRGVEITGIKQQCMLNLSISSGLYL